MQDGKKDWPHGHNQLGQRLAEDGGEDGPHPERLPLLGLMRTEGTQDELEDFRGQEAQLEAQKGTPMQIDADAQTAAAQAKADAAGPSGVTNGKAKEQPSVSKAVIPSEQRQRKRGQGNKGQKINHNNKNGADLRIPRDERVPIPAAAASANPPPGRKIQGGRGRGRADWGRAPDHSHRQEREHSPYRRLPPRGRDWSPQRRERSSPRRDCSPPRPRERTPPRRASSGAAAAVLNIEGVEITIIRRQ
jgi:hypothetical protein